MPEAAEILGIYHSRKFGLVGCWVEETVETAMFIVACACTYSPLDDDSSGIRRVSLGESIPGFTGTEEIRRIKPGQFTFLDAFRAAVEKWARTETNTMTIEKLLRIIFCSVGQRVIGWP